MTLAFACKHRQTSNLFAQLQFPAKALHAIESIGLESGTVRLMMIHFQALLFAVGFASPALAQEVASKDLVRPPLATTEPAPSPATQEPDHADKCSKMGVGFADGMTLAVDKKPRKLKIGLVEISSKILTKGSEITATVKLENAGEKSVQIPWSTDFQTTIEGQDLDKRFWEFAEFEISIRSKRNPKYYAHLVTTSQPLYGSRFVPGSFLTLEPGQWITARISFKIAVRHPEFEELDIGTNTLAMEWFQTSRSRTVKDCGVTLGYFSYDSPFESLNRKEVAQVEIESPESNARPPR